MPFYTALIALLGAYLYWYFFLRQTPEKPRRMSGPQSDNDASHRNAPQQSASPVALINDPVTATTTFLIALAAEDKLDAAAESQIKDDISTVMGVAKPDDLYVFARHAAEQVTDPSNLMIRFARLWVDVGVKERQDVYDMAVRVAALNGGPTDMQAVCLKQLALRLSVQEN